MAEVETFTADNSPDEPGSDEFDTDLEDVAPIKEKRKKKHQPKKKGTTLEVYQAACRRLGLTPRTAFIRQWHLPLIDLRNGLHGVDDVRPVALALMNDHTVRDLDLSDNSLETIGTADVGMLMAENFILKTLKLSNCQIERAGLRALAKCLAENDTMRCLDLSWNKLTSQDQEHIAHIIRTASGLRELFLRNNRLGSPGIEYIVEALEHPKCWLRVLDLEYNHIRGTALTSLANSLAKNSSLRYLNVAWNGCGMEGCRAFGEALRNNKTLRELDLCWARINVQDVKQLAEGLARNTTLHVLRLCNNPMSTLGVKRLLKVLLASFSQTGLKRIYVTGIPVDRELISLARQLKEARGTHVIHDAGIHEFQTRGTEEEVKKVYLHHFNPSLVLFEYMKLDHLRIRDLFYHLDRRDEGEFNIKDLDEGMEALMIPHTEEDLEEIMEELDTDEDGLVRYEDMLRAYKHIYFFMKQDFRELRYFRRLRRGKMERLRPILRDIINSRPFHDIRRDYGGRLTLEPWKI